MLIANKENSNAISVISDENPTKSNKSFKARKSSNKNGIYDFFEIFLQRITNRTQTNKKATKKQKSTKKSLIQNNETLGTLNITDSNVINNDIFTTQHSFFTCKLCLNEFKSDLFKLNNCEHSFCVECLQSYLKLEIMESRISIKCPQCTEEMHPNDIYQSILTQTQQKSILFCFYQFYHRVMELG